jgi:transposase InsO family protein
MPRWSVRSAKDVLKVVHKKYLGKDLSMGNKLSPPIEIAKRREKIILHYETYGKSSKNCLLATLDAFSIGERTFYRWQKIYYESNRDWRSLIPKPTIRKKQNTRWVHPEILKLIQKERFKQIIGKSKLKRIIDGKCKELGITHISETTIGRILKDLKQNKQIPNYKQVTYFAVSGKITKRDKRDKKNDKHRIEQYKPQSPGDLGQVDTIVEIIKGKRVYCINIIDVFTRLVYSKIFTSLNSTNATQTLIEAQKHFKFKFKHIQTDNGLEFYKHFDTYLQKNNIIHFWNYPKCPKMNAFIERFNRTIQEELLNRIRPILKDQPQYVNQKLLPAYLHYYNKQRLHQSLDYKTPYQYYIQYRSLLPNEVD